MGIGKKYDPNDPKVLKRYENTKEGILPYFVSVTFLQEFLTISAVTALFER
jgi:hypothetical protein